MRTTIISEKYEIRDLLRALIEQINMTNETSTKTLLLLQNYENEHPFVRKFIQQYFRNYNTKKCSLCKLNKPASTEYFRKNNQTKDGLRIKCKICESKRDVSVKQIRVKPIKIIKPRKQSKQYKQREIITPRCKQCEHLDIYYINNGNKQHYRCNMIDSINLSDKNILAEDMRYSPKWCSLRK